MLRRVKILDDNFAPKQYWQAEKLSSGKIGDEILALLRVQRQPLLFSCAYTCDQLEDQMISTRPHVLL